MRFSLLPFQEATVTTAVEELRNSIDEVSRVGTRGRGQAVTLVAPTGAGKTVMAAAILEALFWGDQTGPGDDEHTTVVWLSDLPNVNEQTRRKIEQASDRLSGRLVQIETSFRADSLDPGKVYFLNTQKLASTGTLVGDGDRATYNIWDVLSRTIERDPARFLLIIDEAHRGMDRPSTAAAEQAASTVQRFILGSAEMPRTPVILGISATPQRFNDLVAGAGRTIRPAIADIDDVRASGLIKERIKVWRPQHGIAHSDMTLLQRAAQNLHDYQLRWSRYCAREGLAAVQPLLVVQVEDRTAEQVTATSLEQSIEAIEEVTGPLHPDSYAHSFGDAPAAVVSGSRKIRYIRPSDIDQDARVTVVFFKTGLSTGWDCPRAEVMMSFRTARDATFIAQLVGRMVRTPLARRVDGDEALNSVALYLPRYDRSAVQNILRQLKSGDPDYLAPIDAVDGAETVICERNENLHRRVEASARALRTFVVPRPRRLPPVRRLERLAGLLSDHELYEDAPAQMETDLVALLRGRLESRRNDTDFERAIANSRRIGLSSTTLNYLTGQTVETTIQVESTSRSLERLFEQVGEKAGAGLHEKLWRQIRASDPSIDGDTARLYTIAVLGDSGTARALEDHCRQQFDDWYGAYTTAIDALPETARQEFYRLQEHADAPAAHAFTLPMAVESRRNDRSTDYPRHLFQDEDGNYPDVLNAWERDVVEGELARDDSVAWVRNRPRKGWALTIPYDDVSGDPTAMYPDFLFFREEHGQVLVDLVDPHGVHVEDAPAKARGLATYAASHGHLYARIEMVIYDRATGEQQRLSLKQASVRDQVRRVQSQEHLRALFTLAGA